MKGVRSKMKRRKYLKHSFIFLLLMIISLLIISCGKSKEKFRYTFNDSFDTISTITGYAKNQEEFNRYSNMVHDELLRYHKLFDIYNEYPGINNLCSINKNAGIKEVKVQEDIIKMLDFSKEIYALSDGSVNIAIGSLTGLWHNAMDDYMNGEEIRFPERIALEEARKHCNIEDIIIDHENNTVFLKDPKMRIDVGAIAKGYSVEMAKKSLIDMGCSSMLLNIGGNLTSIGKKADGKDWICVIESPFKKGKTIDNVEMSSKEEKNYDFPGIDKEMFNRNDEYIKKIKLFNSSLVTSGDYERFFIYNGEAYNHIIDGKTMYPGNRYRSVSIMTEDSALADGLSTAFFLMDIREALGIIDNLKANGCNLDALWVLDTGEIIKTSGFN